MPVPSVDLETKQQGQTWLLPLYLYSLRQIANELDVGVATVKNGDRNWLIMAINLKMTSPRIIVFTPSRHLQRSL
jgi:hypothetical protein